MNLSVPQHVSSALLGPAIATRLFSEIREHVHHPLLESPALTPVFSGTVLHLPRYQPRPSASVTPSDMCIQAV